MVEARKLPAVTDAPEPKRSPLGLITQICPLPERAPFINVGSEPDTLFNATDALPG